ncbi:MAG: DUF1858 domain-containing protein [Christensenellales bacterium]|jgi:hypothetical protein
MAKKQLDLTKSVYQLCKEDGEILNILSDLGFTDIAKRGMLETVGRIMTIPKGAAAKRFDIEIIKSEFEARGYEIIEGGNNK